MSFVSRGPQIGTDLLLSLSSHLPRHQKTLNSLICADVPLKNYSLTSQLRASLHCETTDTASALHGVPVHSTALIGSYYTYPWSKRD